MLRTPQSKTYSRSALGGCAAGAATVGARPTPLQSPMSSARRGAVRHRSELDRGGMARPPLEFKIGSVPIFVADQGDTAYAPAQTWHRVRFAGSGMATRLAIVGYANSHVYQATGDRPGL